MPVSMDNGSLYLEFNEEEINVIYFCLLVPTEQIVGSDIFCIPGIFSTSLNLSSGCAKRWLHYAMSSE